MQRFKRDIWKVAIVLTGLLGFLVLMIWIPISVAEASNNITGLPTPTPTVQATPTEDATVTKLNKEKLQQDIALDKSNIAKNQSGIDKDRSDILWAWTSALTLLTIIGGVVTGLIASIRYFQNQQAEREQRKEVLEKELQIKQAEREQQAEEHFNSAVEGMRMPYRLLCTGVLHRCSQEHPQEFLLRYAFMRAPFSNREPGERQL